jgi:hypothetical protein
MNKKIVGIFVFTLLIVTAISATGAMNVQTTWYVHENNHYKPYQNTPANSPGFICIKIIAKVAYISDTYNLLGDVIQINDTISGKYTYDSGTPDSNPDPKIGDYRHISSSFGIEVKAGNLVFKTNPSNVDFLIELVNDYGNPQRDFYLVQSYNNLQLSNGMFVDRIYWQLEDNTSSALSNTALPTTAPVLPKWQSKLGLTLIGYDPDNPSKGFVIRAHVTKATKSKARDVYFTTQPILIWLLERFPNIFPILQKVIQRLGLQ